MRTNKEWALHYAALGMRVFPCHFMLTTGCSCGKRDCRSPAKHPRTHNGHDDATTDPELIARWWDECPDANIGIATGEKSGVWVLDLDGPDGIAALVEMEERRGKLPDTVTADTGGGGRHLVFRWDTTRPVKCKTKLSGKSIDTRGSGGYVIVPPSNHRSGKRYEWVRPPGENAIATAPDWLMEFVHCDDSGFTGTTRQRDESAFRELVQALDLETDVGAPEGQRRTRACRLIGSALGRNLSLVRVTAFALGWGGRCIPPMDEEELLQLIEDFVQRDAEKLDDVSIGDGPAMPTLRPEAFHGIAGEFVRAIGPETEADPAAILLQFLVFFGITIGRTAHYLVEATQHFGNLFVVLVGDTASARKGTSYDRVANVFKGVTGVFPPVPTLKGLVSGEGLIWAVRDPIVKAPTSKPVVPGVSDPATLQGVSDKRLIVTESEFASVLSVIKREANTLSPIIREVWQSGDLNSAGKNSPARATNAHIAIIGHITLYELRNAWPSVEGFNGFANRFLWATVQRSKLLPDGGRLLDLTELQQRLGSSIEFASRVETVSRDEQASQLWRERYAGLGQGHMGKVAGVIARAQPQVVRLSMLYALLDRSSVIRLEHLQAAFAMWDYCEQSAVYIFGDSRGNRTAERILTALRESCRTTRDFHRLFHNRLPASELKATLEMLLSQKLIRFENRPTGGRPSQIWYIV